MYHDALVQMTCARCQQWMEERGYLHRWIIPVFGLNDEVRGLDKNGRWTASKVYKKRPPGDSPEYVGNKVISCCCLQM